MNEEEKKAAEQKAADEAKAKADAEAKEKGGKPDSEKTVEELKAEAEAAEAAYKAARGGVSEEELKANMIRRKEKAQEKLARLKEEEEEDPKPRKAPEIAVEDLVTLEVKGIDKNSDEAKILKRYVDAGIVGNYKEAFNHVAVKAELEALGATRKAKAVIDENDTEDVQLKSKKEIVDSYKRSGEVPTDKKAQEAIAKSNLKEMGL